MALSDLLLESMSSETLEVAAKEGTSLSSSPIGESDAPDSKRIKLANNRLFVESVHLSSLIASYNNNFSLYSKGQKQVTQHVPAMV